MNNEISKFLIAPTASVHDAVAAIDRGGRQMALVVDENQHLLATVTDGDIRRGLLRGVGLDARVRDVMHKTPTVITRAEGVEAARRLMREKSLHQVPVVDETGKLVDLAWIDDVTGPVLFDTRVVLMAGGLGSRLRPLTDHTPKPMLTVGERPLLENIIRNFRGQGFHRFTLSLNYKAEIIRDHFKDGAAIDCQIDYVDETTRMGTAGALSLLQDRPTEPFVVMNGDLLTSVQFGALMDFHRETGAMATVCAREFSMQVPYGVIQSEGTRLLGIEEKPTQTYFVSGGIYVLSPEVLDMLEPDTPLDRPQLLDRLMGADKIVSVFPIREYWVDIGRIEDLDRARSEFNSVFGK